MERDHPVVGVTLGGDPGSGIGDFAPEGRLGAREPVESELENPVAGARIRTPGAACAVLGRSRLVIACPPARSPDRLAG